MLILLEIYPAELPSGSGLATFHSACINQDAVDGERSLGIQDPYSLHPHINAPPSRVTDGDEGGDSTWVSNKQAHERKDRVGKRRTDQADLDPVSSSKTHARQQEL